MNSGPDGEGLPDSFVLGDWLVQPSLNRLVRGGETVQLRPKVMDVLALLASRPGEVVGKDVIIDAVWAKEFIADSALSRAVFELRAALGDDPHAPRYVETIAKRGYRLVASVEPGHPQPVEAGASAATVAERRQRWPRLAGAIGLAVAAGLLVTLATPGRKSANLAGSPKIVVLPFKTLGSPDGGVFSSGLSDEITARLVGVQGLAVIAPDASGAERTAGTDAAQLGRQFGATHVLWGTVQWQRGAGAADRVRIMVQLVSTDEGWIAWADSFDRPARDALAVQQEVAGAVLEQLGHALGLDAGEVAGAAGSETAEAQRAYIRGVQHLWSSRGPGGGTAVGLQLLERAVELDPGFGEAHASLAIAHARLYRLGFATSPDHRARANESLRRAETLDGKAPQVRMARACVAFYCDRDAGGALIELRKLPADADLAPSPAEIEAEILRRQGRWKESSEVLERAARGEASDPYLLRQLALDYSVSGRFDDGLSCLDAAVAAAPDDLANYIEKSCCLRRSGRLVDAREALEAAPSAGGFDLERGWYCQELAEGRFTEASRRARSLAREPGATGDPRDHPALLLGQALRLAGESEEARRWFGESRALAEAGLRELPDNSRWLQVLALSLAGVGQRDAAVAAARRAVDLAPAGLDAVESAAALETLAEVLVAVGNVGDAFDTLEQLLAGPSRLSLAILETDERWAVVRADPRFADLRRHVHSAANETAP